MEVLARVAFYVVLSSLAMGDLARVAFDVVLSSLAMGELARVAFDVFCPFWPRESWPE